MDKLDKKNMPLYLIILALVVVFPLGIYYIVLRVVDRLQNIKKVANTLKWVSIIGVLFGVIYFFANYSIYVSLIDSHMNLDMYSFNFIYIYLYIIMIVVSSLVGSIYLNRKCADLIIYTEFINIRHIKDIKLISDENLESIDEVKKNINNLIDKGFLINIRVEGNQIVSTKTVDKKNESNLVKCKSCGNVESLNKTKRCSFCMRKFSKKDYIL